MGFEVCKLVKITLTSVTAASGVLCFLIHPAAAVWQRQIKACYKTQRKASNLKTVQNPNISLLPAGRRDDVTDYIKKTNLT